MGRGETTGFKGGRGAVEALRGAGGGGTVAQGATAAAAGGGGRGECWSYKGTDQAASGAAATATGGRGGGGDRGGGGEEEEEHSQAGKRGKEKGRRGRELTLSEGSA